MSNVYFVANKFECCFNSYDASIKNSRNYYGGPSLSILTNFFYAMIEMIAGSSGHKKFEEHFVTIADAILKTEEKDGKYECVISVGREQYAIQYYSGSNCISFAKVGSWQTKTVYGTFDGLKEIVLRECLKDKRAGFELASHQSNVVDLSEFDLQGVDYESIAEEVGVDVYYARRAKAVSDADNEIGEAEVCIDRETDYEVNSAYF